MHVPASRASNTHTCTHTQCYNVSPLECYFILAFIHLQLHLHPKNSNLLLLQTCVHTEKSSLFSQQNSILGSGTDLRGGVNIWKLWRLLILEKRAKWQKQNPKIHESLCVCVCVHVSVILSHANCGFCALCNVYLPACWNRGDKPDVQTLSRVQRKSISIGFVAYSCLVSEKVGVSLLHRSLIAAVIFTLESSTFCLKGNTFSLVMCNTIFLLPTLQLSYILIH